MTPVAVSATVSMPLSSSAKSEAYAALKRRLANAHPADMNAYMDGKHPFIQDHQARALRWAANR